MRGLPLSTRQVSDVVQLDEDILRPKGGRHVKDDSDEIEDPDIKENFFACTMCLSCPSPLTITPEILRNRGHAAEYLAHVALIRELVDQSSMSTNSQLLSGSTKRLFKTGWIVDQFL